MQCGTPWATGCLQVNPARAPEVVGALLDAEAPDDFVNNLILSVRSLIPVERLCAEVEKRNRLKLLSPFLEHLVSEGSQVCCVHLDMYCQLFSSCCSDTFHCCIEALSVPGPAAPAGSTCAQRTGQDHHRLAEQPRPLLDDQPVLRQPGRRQVCGEA